MTRAFKLPSVDGEPDDHALPEQRLMMATIATAVSDALGSGFFSTKAQRDRAQAEALAWFQENGSDFRYVCHIAGLDPAHVRKCVLEFVASGQPMPRTGRVRTVHARRADDKPNVGEIAELAGVSSSTVRNVLKKRGSVAADIKASVMAAMNELCPDREAA